METTPEETGSPLFERQPRAVARALSQLEAGGQAARSLLQEIYPRTGRARVIGFTGPPGAGKSTLVDRVCRLCRARDETVAIIAVDPSSPFSGGAVLGDRVRMQGLYTDPGVFIRSMATRGALGGLARTTHDAIDLLDAVGFDWILVETVGVGQDEVDVVGMVDTVVVVTLPGLGDEIQAIKAGLMEIADVFVINKADRAGVEATRRDLEMLLSTAGGGSGASDDERPAIVTTVATDEQGIDELLQAIETHLVRLESTGERQRRRRRQFKERVRALVAETFVRRLEHRQDLDQLLLAALEAG